MILIMDNAAYHLPKTDAYKAPSAMKVGELKEALAAAGLSTVGEKKGVISTMVKILL